MFSEDNFRAKLGAIPVIDDRLSKAVKQQTLVADKANRVGPMAKSVGFLELGRTYARSADFLSDAVRLKTLEIAYNHPVDYLYAHAFELMFKGCLLQENPNGDVEVFGHDLLRLYDEVKSQALVADLIKSVELALRERWRRHLRDARDRYGAVIGLGPLSTEENEEFGIFGNDVIGKELPELRQQIIWLSKRHSHGGGKFRYLQCGLDNRRYIKAFGLSDDVVWRSSQWACEEIYDRFQMDYFSKPDR